MNTQVETGEDQRARAIGSIGFHPILRTHYDTLGDLAMATYNRFYDNELYVAATDGKPMFYANLLIDEALCICGSPFYKPASWEWDADAIAFLRRFIECMAGDDGPGPEYVEAFNLAWAGTLD